MKIHSVLETILHHLQQDKEATSREELRAAIEDMKDWCDEIEAKTNRVPTGQTGPAQPKAALR
jgi:hypothetical protein